MFIRTRILRKPEDGQDAGGAGAGAGASKVDKAEYDRAVKERDALKAKADKADADERKAKDKKRAEEEGHAKLLEERDAANATMQKQLAAYDKRERERVEKSFEALPEANRKKLEKMKDKLELAEWRDLVDAEIEFVTEAKKAGDSTTPPPPFGAPGPSQMANSAETNKLVPNAEKILTEKMGKDLKRMRNVASNMTVRHSETGAPIMSMNIGKWWNEGKRNKGVALSSENAEKRGG